MLHRPREVSDMIRWNRPTVIVTDQNKQTTSLNNKRYYLVNLLQFLSHTYQMHPESANKSHEKATLSRLTSHAFRDASQPI